MSFLNPLMLWGLAGVGIPVLVHLLNLYRHQETDWAAMRFLSRAARVRSRQIRLQDLLLMLLRCLAVFLFVAALTRPVIRPTGAASAIGEARAGVVVAIDGSYSMAHRTGERSRFDRAIERARQIAGTIKQGDPCALVLVGAHHRIVMRGHPFEPGRFNAALDELTVLAEHADLDSLPQTIAPLLADMTVAQKEAYFITDVQARDWVGMSQETRRAYRQIGQAGRFSIVPVSTGNHENLAVTSFRLTSGGLRRDSIARYTAQVANFGTQMQSNVRVVCRVNDTPVDEQTIGALAPGAMGTVSLFAPMAEAGRIALRAEIPADELTLDNVRHAVAHVREQLRVLCIDGSPASEPYAGAADFVASSLTLPSCGRDAGTLEVDTLPWNALPSVDFDRYRVIVLADVAEIPEPLVSKLSTYVQAGGALIVFAGPNMRAPLWNERLLDGPVRLLPARIVGPAAEPFGQHDGWPLDTALPDHPLCGPLTTLPSDLLGQVRFWRYLVLRPVGDAQVALRIAPDGAPLVVEGRVGRGRVAMFASTANRAWHNMVINPAFPMLIQQCVVYLTRGDMEVPVLVGNPIVVPLDDMDVDEEVVFIEPTGRTTPTRTISRQGRTVGMFERTEQVGLHRVQCEVATPAFMVAVNPETAESDVRSMPGDQLDATARELGMDVLQANASVAAAISETRLGRELWMPILVLAVVATACEAFLSYRISRRRFIRARRAG